MECLVFALQVTDSREEYESCCLWEIIKNGSVLHVYRDYDTKFIKERIAFGRITANGRDHKIKILSH